MRKAYRETCRPDEGFIIASGSGLNERCRQPNEIFVWLLFIGNQRFISETRSMLVAAISIHAGRNPLAIAWRADRIFDHAAQ